MKTTYFKLDNEYINVDHITRVYKHESVDEVMVSLQLVNGVRIEVSRERVAGNRTNLPELRNRALATLDATIGNIGLAVPIDLMLQQAGIEQ